MLIVERTHAGLIADRSRGCNGIRSHKISPQKFVWQYQSCPIRIQRHLVAKELGIIATTLYDYVNGDGTPKKTALNILNIPPKNPYIVV